MVGPIIFLFIIVLMIGNYARDKRMDQNREKVKENMGNLIKKYEVPVNDYIETYFFTGHPLIDNQNYKKHFYKWDETRELKPVFLIWIYRNNFNILRTNISYYEVAQIVKIPLHDIKSYKLVGEIKERMYINGGGGGGSSLTGAVIGGVVAGVPGAIIGSRKKNDPIKTTYETKDSRYLEINFNYDGMNKRVVECKELYEYFYKHMPEKTN